jgi:hypothetical protein
MGAIKNLWLLAKTGGGRRALSRADLFSYCEPMIQKPPAPPELLQAMQGRFVRWEGVPISLVEYYRRHNVVPALERVASEPTWERQRATCLREILNETHWANWQSVLKRAESEWGREIVLGKLRQMWPHATVEELEAYLLQFYVVTICTNAVLATVGKTFYKVDEVKELEIKLYEQYGRDIYLLDIAIMDLAFNVFADDYEAAYSIAGWKDDRLSPLLRDMFHHLTATKEQIIESTFDVAEFKRISDQLERQKALLAEEILGRRS